MKRTKKVALVGMGVVVMGSLCWVATASSATANEHVGRYQARNQAVVAVRGPAPVAQAARSALPAAERKLVLVPPPQELPTINSKAMVTSSVGNVPTRAVPAKRLLRPAPVVRRAAAPRRAVKAHRQVQAAPARVRKPQMLFSYARLLNFTPHPTTEDILKDKPVALNGKNYWFKIRYLENWKVLNDDDGHLQDLAFEIKVMENDKEIRVLKTPRVALNPKKLKKGMVLGIAEVAPYRFKIIVDSFSGNRKAISELVFKLDRMG